MGTRTCSREYYNFRDGKSVLSVLKYDGENPPFYTSYKKFRSKIINNRIKICFIEKMLFFLRAAGEKNWAFLKDFEGKNAYIRNPPS